MGQAIPVLCQLVLTMCDSLIHPYVLAQDMLYNTWGINTSSHAQWLKWGGLSPPAPVWAPLLLLKKCYFMHKMCQFPTSIDDSVPWACSVPARPGHLLRMPPIRERIPSASAHRGTAQPWVDQIRGENFGTLGPYNSGTPYPNPIEFILN